MASFEPLTKPHEVVAALVPGDGRVRFCHALVSSLRAGDWVEIDGPLGREPGRILFEARRVDFPLSTPTLFTIERRLTDVEFAALESLVERARSLIDVTKRAIAAVDPDVVLAGLRFTLDGATALCHCFGATAAPPVPLVAALHTVVGCPVRIEWSDRAARSFGGLGRIWTETHDDESDVRARLQIDLHGTERFPHGWPRLGSEVVTTHGLGRLVSVSVRHRTTTVRLSSGGQIEVPLEELSAPGD